ncbi:MAG TPA: protein phosphatase 2C domain-containing protein, partial [Anaerolineaceae bacterium]|nr:protein phosphatase 2C domain-containing protein [Anaerolineaceae bacterium]
MVEEGLLLNNYSVAAKSAVGDTRRRYEDRARTGLVSTHLGQTIVGVVADGVGSADFGANAAQVAVDSVFSYLEKGTEASIPEMIDSAIKLANQAVNAENAKTVGDGQTTLVVAVIHNDRVYIGNVGDSRAYWVQGTGKLVQLTQDHTYYNRYGGDPNSEDADTVVNAIGLRESVGVDIGFYIDHDNQDKKRAFSLGKAGLPLKDGDSILLCSDGLIKKSEQGQRFTTDQEIVESIQTEYAPAAVVKMVGFAEGRKVDDNVSAVLLQRLSKQRIALMQHRKEAARRKAVVRSVLIAAAILLLVVGLGFSAKALFDTQKELADVQDATPVIIQITNTPMPSLTPTLPIASGMARVEQVNGEEDASYQNDFGDAGILRVGVYLEPGTLLGSSDGSVRILAGAIQGVPGTFILLPLSRAQIWFGEKLTAELYQGSVYLNPGYGGGLVNLPDFPDVAARLLEAGGHIVVQKMNDSEVAVLCFKGPCEIRVPSGSDLSWVSIKDGEKRIFNITSRTLTPGELMTYDEKLQVNVDCGSCLYIFNLIPTPTPKPTGVKSTPVPVNEDENQN